MSKRQIYIQSEMLKSCCEAEEWDYDDALESFEYFYRANRSNLKGGLREAVATWYKYRKMGKAL